MSREDSASFRRMSEESAEVDIGLVRRFSDYIRAAFNERHAKKQALIEMINTENSELLSVIERAKIRNKEFNIE